ncbi:MAG TPA: class I SAM-dependent methyltransferase [Puia sp.]|nr:class I SAM-dependent methyltransferase [Puia sp.]
MSIGTNNIYIPGLDRTSSRLALHAGHHDRCVRGFTDDEVEQLPDLPKTHSQYRYWQLRKKSCRRLIHHLAFEKRALSILEVGCGNGWLSNHLSSIPGHRVLGLDRDLRVLQQAARVFRHQPNLKFMCGDFYSGIIQGLTFDAIIFSASIQYFPSLRDVLTAALMQLAPKGEIHILDTPLTRKDLAPFKYRMLFNPHSLSNRLLGRSHHLPWISICSLNLRHERNTASPGPDTGRRILL